MMESILDSWVLESQSCHDQVRVWAREVINLESVWSAVLLVEMTKIWSSILSKTAAHVYSLYLSPLSTGSLKSRGS